MVRFDLSEGFIMISKFPRRKFLNAVGALWGLSWTEQVELSNMIWGRSDDENDDGISRMKNCGNGLFWAYLDERRGHNGSISVAVDPENGQSPIVIEAYLDRSRVAVGLGPEESSALAKELMNAAEKIQSHHNGD